MGNKLISTKLTVPFIIILRITQWVGFTFGMSIPTGMHSRMEGTGETIAKIIITFVKKVLVFFVPK